MQALLSGRVTERRSVYCLLLSSLLALTVRILQAASCFLNSPGEKGTLISVHTCLQTLGAMCEFVAASTHHSGHAAVGLHVSEAQSLCSKSTPWSFVSEVRHSLLLDLLVLSFWI